MAGRIGVVCATFLCAGLAGANEFNGRFSGTIEGRAIDVPVQCERNGGWLVANSDPSLHGGAEDRNGDGLVASVSGSQDAGQAVFTVKFGEDLYRFNGSRDVVFTEDGLTMRSTLHRYAGSGQDRKIDSSYDVDIVVACSD